MFVGRKNELKIITDFLNSNSSALLIYGKRRVGKTELINESFKQINKKYVYFECLKDTIERNISAFMQVLTREGVLSNSIEVKKFSDIFYYLKLSGNKIDIVIDEYPYLKTFEEPDKIDSDFQTIIDQFVKEYHLIISGSQISMMKSLLKEGNPLFGRTDVVLHLKELNYLETSEFYLNKSIYDKIAFYAVFGGSPLINEKINPNLSLKENIINTFLKVDSPVYNYCNNILFTDVPESYNIKALCMLLKNGKRSAVEIENAFNIDKTGNINKKLNTLVEMDLIKKYYPINKMDNHKRAKYEINDNAIRFFYTFVQQNLSLLYVLGEDRFYEEFIENKITTFISHRFEEMVRDYFILAIHKGEYKNIINVGTYYYDDSYKKINGEFDVALALKNGKYEIVEVKYYKTNPLTLKEMSEEEAQIKLIKEINIEKISFISTSGTETQDIYSTIDVDKMYNL